MSMSLFARHRQRSRATSRRSAGINLVSLMDIFTILVFFLLINSSSVQQPSGGKSLTLPQARAEKLPPDALVVMVSEQEIIVQGRHIATIAEAEAGDAMLIKPLYDELSYQAGKSQQLQGPSGEGRELIVLGDKAIPYTLLKRIMVTCTEAGYTTLSLAVTRKAKG